MRCFLLLACLLFLPLAAQCQTQAEMNETASQDFAKLDTELNAVYKQLLAKYADDPAFAPNLREAQRAWLKFVDLHVQTLFPVGKGEDPRQLYGSMYSIDVLGAKTPLYEERIGQLKEMLANQ